LRTVAEPNYPETVYEIIGVTKDTKYAGLREEIPPMAYVPDSQNPHKGPWSNFCVRSFAPLGEVSRAIERRTAELHPGVRMQFRVFEKQIQEGLLRERLMAALSGFFGVLAALLAAVGLYGVMAYMVVRRRSEIGIRMALGAGRGRVLKLVMGEAGVLLVIGIAVGIAGSLALTKAAASLLFGLSAHDPGAFLGSTLLLGVVAALGSYLPARRASRLDPMDALRCD
jgi:ABC-type antimicrobial peptide transport system permease subunit